MKFPTSRLRNIATVVIAFVAVVCGISLVHDSALSQARLTRVVVPYPPGGINESMMRVLADQIGRQGGPSFVIEARPGAGTMIATEAVSRAVPDGNTILIVSNSFVINAHLKKLAYDPLTSFEPICGLWQSPMVLAVNSASQYRTFADLLTAARARPGELTMGASGPATGFHIAFEQLKQAAHINMTFVPYGGAVPAVNALLGDHIVSTIGDFGAMVEHLRSGKLRALATARRTRIEALPEVPTVAESGFNEYEADGWYGLVAPAKTPRERITVLTDWLTGALRDFGVREKLAGAGLYPTSSCGASFGAHVRKQHEVYGRVIREANIKAE